MLNDYITDIKSEFFGYSLKYLFKDIIDRKSTRLNSSH